MMRHTHNIPLSFHWAPTSPWCQTWPRAPVISWEQSGKVWIQLSAHPISAQNPSLKTPPGPRQPQVVSSSLSCSFSKPTHHLCCEQPLKPKLSTNTCPCPRTQHLLRAWGAHFCPQQGRPGLGSDAAVFVSAATTNDTKEQKPKQNTSPRVSWKIHYPAPSVVIHVPHFSHN